MEGCIPSSIVLSYFDYRLRCIAGAVYRRIVLSFHTSGGISSSPAAFLFLILLRTESSSSLVKGPSFTSNCLLIILVIGSSVISGGFPSRFLKCCSHSFYSFLLACSFQFCFGCALPSTYFIYCLPGYPGLPIFHRVSCKIWWIWWMEKNKPTKDFYSSQSGEKEVRTTPGRKETRWLSYIYILEVYKIIFLRFFFRWNISEISRLSHEELSF